MKMTKNAAAASLANLRPFISVNQRDAIAMGMAGEESTFFSQTARGLSLLIATMPKSYETDGEGFHAVAQLHYFKGGCDWYITEKDAGCKFDGTPGKQLQAFGLADLGYGAELGYISIAELIENGVELDLYWTPKPLAQITKIKAAA